MVKASGVAAQFAKRTRVSSSTVLNTILEPYRANKRAQILHSSSQDHTVDFLHKVLRGEPLDVHQINRNKEAYPAFQKVFHHRFVNLTPPGILKELTILSSCNIKLDISQDIVDNLDSYVCVENLHQQPLNRFTSIAIKNYEQFCTPVQLMVLFKMLLPLGEFKLVDEMLIELNQKMPGDQFLLILDAVKLYKGEVTFDQFNTEEISQILTATKSQQFIYILLEKYIGQTKDVKRLSQLLKIYSHSGIIDEINDRIKLDTSDCAKLTGKFAPEYQLDHQKLKYYVERLIDTGECKFEELRDLNLPRTIIQKYQQDQRHLNPSPIKHIVPLKNVLDYHQKRYSRLLQFVRSLNAYKFNYFAPEELKACVRRLTDDKKILLAHEMVQANVITDYSLVLLEPSLLDRIRHGVSEETAIDKLLTIFDDESIEMLLSKCTDENFVNKVVKKWAFPSFSPDYTAHTVEEQLRKLELSPAKNTTAILQQMMEKYDPFEVMNVIASNKADQLYIKDLLGPKFQQVSGTVPLGFYNIVALTFHFWKLTDFYNMKEVSAKYRNQLSKNRCSFEFIQHAIASNNFKILNNISKFKMSEYPHVKVETIKAVKPVSVLRYQRTMKQLTRLEPANITREQLEEVLGELSEKYHPVLFRYLPRLVTLVPYSPILFKSIYEAGLQSSRNATLTCKFLGVDIDNDIRYKERRMLKFDFNYLVLVLYHLLNKGVKLDGLLPILRTSIMQPTTTIDETSFEIVEAVSKSVHFNLKGVNFESENTSSEQIVRKMVTLAQVMGVLRGKFEPIPNLTVSSLIKTSHVMTLAPEFKKVELKDILSFWFVMMNSNGEKKETFMESFGFWDLLSTAQKTDLLSHIHSDFSYEPSMLTIKDFNLFLRALFYTGKYRDLSIEEVNYFVNVINRLIACDSLSHKEKSFAIHIGYTLISKNSSILFKFHKDLITRLPGFKIFKENINMVLVATCNTKISDLGPILEQLVATHKGYRYEVDAEVTNVLNMLVSENNLEVAEELYLQYCTVCKHPRFKYNVSETMAWGKSMGRPRGEYKKGVVNTKVNGMNVTLFDKMLDD